MVLDPVLFREEAESLEKSGIPLRSILKISKKVHLIMPTHRLLDAANEKAKGSSKIGTTGKGIRPTYTDKISRNGLRLGDTLLSDFRGATPKRATVISTCSPHSAKSPTQPSLKANGWMPSNISRLSISSTANSSSTELADGKSVLCEGAQGTLLDVDFGSYPFVTSSNTITAGACAGLGVAPNRIGDVYGIFKAYCTRVGSGPFPTELFDETGRLIRDLGHEYGAVTGRERRCGWIDLVALRYAIMIDGVTKLIMMKSDVLDGFDEIKACVAYEIDGKRVEDFPYTVDGVDVKPVYVTLPGWKTDMTGMKSEQEFPKAFSDYVAFLEKSFRPR